MARKMRDSGVEWIGEVPEGWEVIRTKHKFYHTKRVVGDNAKEYERLALTMQGVIKRDKEDSNGLQPKEFEGYQILEENELVFKLIDLQNISTSRVGRSPFVGIVSPAYIVIHHRNESNTRFEYYYFLAMWMHDIFQTLGGDAVRSCLNASDLLNVPLLSPPLPEQRRIADYLDEKCAAIDGAVDELKRGIEDCKAWKKAIIFEAVTGKQRIGFSAEKQRGRVAERPMRDSGIPWIGEIPEGWEVRRLKGIAIIAGRIGFRGYTTADIVGEGEGALSLSPSNLNDIVMTYSKRTYISWSKYQESPEIMVYEGDIVMVKTGASYGKACIVESLPCKATLNPQLVVLKNVSCERRFLNYYLQTPFSRYQADLTVVGGTIPTMSQEKMGRWLVVLPTLPEQQAIADFLDEKCAAIDALVAEKEELIADLEAYKKSLIFELVTGKREVA